jgi:hypothetical protein
MKPHLRSHGVRLETILPSRNEVDEALSAIETEDERQKEALRKFYDRERPGMFVSWRAALSVLGVWGIAAIIVGAGLFWLYGFVRAIQP